MEEIAKKVHQLQLELESWILHASCLSDGDVAALYSAIEVLIDVRNELTTLQVQSVSAGR
jgi:hypothetical protein